MARVLCESEAAADYTKEENAAFLISNTDAAEVDTTSPLLTLYNPLPLPPNYALFTNGLGLSPPPKKK